MHPKRNDRHRPVAQRVVLDPLRQANEGSSRYLISLLEAWVELFDSTNALRLTVVEAGDRGLNRHPSVESLLNGEERLALNTVQLDRTIVGAFGDIQGHLRVAANSLKPDGNQASDDAHHERDYTAYEKSPKEVPKGRYHVSIVRREGTMK